MSSYPEPEVPFGWVTRKASPPTFCRWVPDHPSHRESHRLVTHGGLLLCPACDDIRRRPPPPSTPPPKETS